MTTSANASERPSRIHAVLNHISIRVKLGALAAISALALVAMSGFQVWQTYQAHYEGRKVAIRQSVETASAIVEWAERQETSGAMSPVQARQAALAALKVARYGKTEYFWVNDMEARVIMHPIKPELDGQDGHAIKDPQGNSVFVMFADKVKNEGSGFVSYLWPKPGRDKPVEKVSYVKGFKPWGWVVGSGLYMDDLQDVFLTGLWQAGLGILAALALTMVMVHLVYQSITRGLAKASRVAKAISQGDVSHEILLIGSDEIGDLIAEMKVMSEQLNATMTQVFEAATSLDQSSQEIASASQDLSSRTEKTAINLQQTASTLASLTGSVQNNSESAQHANDSMASATTVANEGGQIVSKAVDAMSRISRASKQIEDITSVIDGIAFQTNILALNAAVEAARAGEQGRGFAVVASEVRTLAQRAALSAKEIKALIAASVQETSSGAGLVQAAGESMNRIVTSVKDVHNLIHGITASSTRQGTEIGNVNTSIDELDRMTQQNAALVEQSAAAASTLSDHARQLTDVVKRFKLAA